MKQEAQTAAKPLQQRQRPSVDTRICLQESDDTPA